MFTYVLVANASEAFLYKTNNLRTEPLILEKKFQHNSSRKKGISLTSDAPGHYATDHGSRSAYEEPDPKKIEAQHFAKELIHVISEGEKKIHHCKKFVFIAPPYFYGLIKKELACPEAEIVHIAKDYTKLSREELSKRLKEQLFV